MATDASLLLLYVIYRELSMLWRGDERCTWPGFSLVQLFDAKAIYTYISFAVPSALMMCLEWWAFEVLVISAGMVKENVEIEVATMGIMINICLFFYLFPSCIGYSVNTRVANELGAGSASGAKLALRVALLSSLLMQSFFIALLFFLRSSIARIFTDDQKVIDLVDSIVPLFCVQLLTDGVNNIAGGVLRGCGRQNIGALINLVTYWFLVVPLGLFLGLSQNQGAYGFWLALAAGMGIQSIVYSFVLLPLDWEVEVERAQDLVTREGDREEGEGEWEGVEDPDAELGPTAPLVIKFYPLRLSNDGVTSPHPHPHGQTHWQASPWAHPQISRSPPIPSSASSLRMLHP